MEKIKSSSKIELKINLLLTEVEARALKALTVFGTKAFIKVYTEQLSKYELKDHIPGIESLFETIKQELPQHLNKIDKAREALRGT